MEPLPLFKFVSGNLLDYFSYIGSLTTPPCSEKVVWIEYPQAIDISEIQVMKIFQKMYILSWFYMQIRRFRELTANDDHMKNNYRPTQKLNDRIVYEHVPIDIFPVMSAIPFVDVANSAWSVSYGGMSFTCFVLYIATLNLKMI